MSLPANLCPKCAEPSLVADMSTNSGNLTCNKCGTVVYENPIVSEVSFGETASGGAVVQGTMMGSDQIRAPLAGRQNAMDSREQTLSTGRRNIKDLAASLRIPDFISDAAFGWFRLALNQNFVQGRRSQNVTAACLYIACRKEKTSHLLIDFSSRLQISVFSLGATFLKMVRTLNIVKLPLADPSLFISHFAEKLDFDRERPNATNQVIHDALKLALRMAQDSIVEGRRPAGIAGACVLLAARMNGFKRTHSEIVSVAHVSEDTLQNRLDEFGRTSAGALRIKDFREKGHDLENAKPPSYTRNKLRYKKETMKSKLRLKKLQDAYNYMQKQPPRSPSVPSRSPSISIGSPPISARLPSISSGGASRRLGGLNSRPKALSTINVSLPSQSSLSSILNPMTPNGDNSSEPSDTEPAPSEPLPSAPSDPVVTESSETSNSTEPSKIAESQLAETPEPTENSDKATETATEKATETATEERSETQEHETSDEYESARATPEPELFVEEDVSNSDSENIEEAEGPKQKRPRLTVDDLSQGKTRSLRKRNNLSHVERVDDSPALIQEMSNLGFTEEQLSTEIESLESLIQDVAQGQSHRVRARATDESEIEALEAIEKNKPVNLVKYSKPSDYYLNLVSSKLELDDVEFTKEEELEYFCDEELKLAKQTAWISMNKDYLLEQERKKSKLETDELTGNTSGTRKKKRSVKANGEGLDMDTIGVSDAINDVNGEPVSAAASVTQMLAKKSKKINYDTLNDLFAGS